MQVAFGVFDRGICLGVSADFFAYAAKPNLPDLGIQAVIIFKIDSYGVITNRFYGINRDTNSEKQPRSS